MTRLQGRYQLFEKLGEGGMAEVYRAHHIALEREVAIKFIASHLNDEMASARFEREAKAVARLNHPNIVQVYDFDRGDDGRYFMVMELLKGKDLGQILKAIRIEEKRLPLTEVARIIWGMGEAIGYAHQQGIVHRDVKPGNVFITDDKRVVMTDFGLAKMLSEQQMTLPNTIIGTPSYLAPEQISNQNVDHRVDIYALGIIFYELLIGQPPYRGETFVAILAQHTSAPIPDPMMERPEVPLSASAIIHRALAKKADERYNDVHEFLADLKVFEQEIPTISDEKSGLFTDKTSSGSLKRDAQSLSITSRTSLSDATVVTASVGLQRMILAALFFGVLSIVGVIGLGAWLLFNNGTDSEAGASEDGNISTEAPMIQADVMPATQDEYLVIVTNFVGDDTSQIDTPQRITDILKNGNLAASLGDQLRLEQSQLSIRNESEAEELAMQTNALLVIWGVQDNTGLQITIQAHGYPERTLTSSGFIIPSGEDFNDILTKDMPLALSSYTANLIAQRLMYENDLSRFYNIEYGSYPVTALRILPRAPLDQYVLDSMLAEDPEVIDANSSAALAIVPDDPNLLYRRWLFNAALLQRPERANQDYEKLAQMLPNNEVVHFMKATQSFFWGDYKGVIEFSDTLDNPSPYVLFYRYNALLFTGDFATALDELNALPPDVNAEIVNLIGVGSEVVRAIFYEVIGDEESAEIDRTVMRASRGLDEIFAETATDVVQTSDPPIGYIFFAGYISEVNRQVGFARVAYQLILDREPNQYLTLWRMGIIAEIQRNYPQAAQYYQTAIDNAPVPFPVAIYRYALLVKDYGEALENLPTACSLLTDAMEQANTQPDLYAVLLGRIIETQAELECPLENE